MGERYWQTRRFTQWLQDPLGAEDCCLQSMPDASPVKWHLAHTTWFFETFVLREARRDHHHFHPEFNYLYNSYYNAVGPQYPRPRRGLLSRPSLEEVLAYRAAVDRQMLDLLDSFEECDPLAPVIHLGINHEQQHQELLLTDIKHLFAGNPLRPVYRKGTPREAEVLAPLGWRAFPAGPRWIGHEGPGFAFDNEGPRHQVYLEAFELADRLVTCEEFLEFVADGGYRRPELWLSEGWQLIRGEGWRAPLYWEEREGRWWHYRLTGMAPVAAAEPVVHVSYFEADAYARWARARLPTEAEWEAAAVESSGEGTWATSGRWHPAPAPALRAPGVLAQMLGDAWEWTASPFVAYPRYRPAAGALGEYNGKFMSNQMVLRGGSCASPPGHLRHTYRNFFPPSARWQFSGIRLARDG